MEEGMERRVGEGGGEKGEGGEGRSGERRVEESELKKWERGKGVKES